MRRAVITLLLFSLGACAEVTTFRKLDGSVYHHVNCGDTLKLESCRSAAERTCANGFSRIAVSAVGDNVAAQRCASDNEERRRDGEPELRCPQIRQTDNFFVCK